jgi:hypothetical protein
MDEVDFLSEGGKKETTKKTALPDTVEWSQPSVNLAPGEILPTQAVKAGAPAPDFSPAPGVPAEDHSDAERHEKKSKVLSFLSRFYDNAGSDSPSLKSQTIAKSSLSAPSGRPALPVMPRGTAVESPSVSTAKHGKGKTPDKASFLDMPVAVWWQSFLAKRPKQASQAKAIQRKKRKDGLSESEWEDIHLVEADLLLRGQNSSSDKFSALALLVSSLLLSLLCVSAAYTVLVGYEKNFILKSKAYENDMDYLAGETMRLQVEMDRQRDVYERIKALRSLLSERPSWTSFFAAVEALTYSDVYYKGEVRADDNGLLNLQAVAPSYDRMEQQLKHMRSTSTVVSALSDEASLDEGGVTFPIGLQLDRKVFKR